MGKTFAYNYSIDLPRAIPPLCSRLGLHFTIQAFDPLEDKPFTAKMRKDLTLILGGNHDNSQTELMVFHQVMANGSSVFEAMLRPGQYREGSTLLRNDHLTLPLPEDDEEAMIIICNILHMQSPEVPTATITPDILDSISTLVDKYEFARAIQPWPKIWLEQEHIQAELKELDKLPIEQLVKWVHICSQLGYSDQFEQSTSILVKRVALEDFEQSSFADQFAKLSINIQDKVKVKRQICADRFRRLSLDLIEDLEQGKACTVEGYGQEANFHCSSVLLGNALLALGHSFGPKWRKEGAWTASITEIHNGMVKVAEKLTGPSMFAGINGAYYHNTRSHSGCQRSSGLLKQIAPIYDAAQTGLELKEGENVFHC